MSIHPCIGLQCGTHPFQLARRDSHLPAVPKGVTGLLFQVRQPDIDHQRLCIGHIQWWQRQLICWALGCRSGQVARFWLGHARNGHSFCLQNVPSPWPLLVLHTQDLWWPWLTYCHQFSIAYYFWSDSQASNVELTPCFGLISHGWGSAVHQWPL